MIDFQQRIEALAGTTANLIAQLRELERLRDRVRKAKLWARDRGGWTLEKRERSPGRTGARLMVEVHAPPASSLIGLRSFPLN